MAEKYRPKLCLTMEEIRGIGRRRRFTGLLPEDVLAALGEELLAAASPVIWYDRPEKDRLEAAVTLGREADALILGREQEGRLLEAYVLDCLAGELLMQLTESLNEAPGLAGNALCGFDFPESDKAGVARIGRILSDVSADIRQNEVGMMDPLHSVVFTARLQAAGSGKHSGICASCKRKDCPDRREAFREKTGGHAQRAGAAAYSYGYQKIFGNREVPFNDKK